MALNNELARMRQSVLAISTASLAALSGINPNRLSLYLGGTRQLPNLEILKLEDTFADLGKLVDAANPWPLSFKDVGRIRDLIGQMKAGEFDRRQP
jgi:hypothetical protein